MIFLFELQRNQTYRVSGSLSTIGSKKKQNRRKQRKSLIGAQGKWRTKLMAGIRPIKGHCLSRTRGVAQFSETWKSRSNFMKCGASLTVPAPCQWYSIQSNLLISLSFHDYSQKRSSSLETIYFQDIVEICRRIYNVFK